MLKAIESAVPQLSYSDETLCQGNAWDYANQGIRQAQNNIIEYHGTPAVTVYSSMYQSWPILPRSFNLSKGILSVSFTTFLVPDTYYYEGVNRVKKTDKESEKRYFKVILPKGKSDEGYSYLREDARPVT